VSREDHRKDPRDYEPNPLDYSIEGQVKSVLTVVRGAYEGIPFTIGNDVAEHIIKEHKLTLECRHCDMSGEKSALFEYEGKTLRLERTWTGRWEIYLGDWKPDPHWTGD